MPLDISILPAAMAAMAMLGLAWDTLAPASLRQAARPRFLRTPAARPRRQQAAGSGELQLASLQHKLQELEATVARLRQTGHSVVSQRDAARAEAASLRLALGAAQQELARVRQHEELEFLARAVLRDPPPPPMVFAAPDPGDAGRFRAAKLAFARLYHPDRGGSSDMDRLVRSQVFKEFWAELERIEKG